MFGNYRGQEGESIPAHRAARVSNFTDPSEDSTRSRPNRRQRQSSNAASEVSSSASSPERDTDAEFYMVQPNDSQSSIGVVPLHELNMKEKERRGPPINMLPSEILIAIFSKLSSPHDLRHCMLVSKTWAGHSVGLLWHRPVCNNMNTMINVAQTVSREHTFFKYEDLIKRLNLASQPLAKEVNDGTLEAMSGCKKIERLTLTGCQMITDSGIMALIDGNHYLLALDVSGIVGVTDATLLMAASNCKRLQGLNVTGNVEITDRSVIAIAEGCKHLKRLKLNDCNKVTDSSVGTLATKCRQMLEIDLYRCVQITDVSVSVLLTRAVHLRELRLAFCKQITNDAFMNLHLDRSFDSLRILDLTACEHLTDMAVRQVIELAPKLRNLVLAKCNKITDLAVMAIARLGKNLHYVHLGHCINITDSSIKRLIGSCNRIRYIDLACCNKLTDESIQLLATLPKLRRIGLVKCIQVTDASIMALAKAQPRSGSRLALGASSLERVHLSYCERLTIQGIHSLLINCPKLTHLSLTGVSAFLGQRFTKFCRPAPDEFNAHQQQVFCVFSGIGVSQLRNCLNTDMLAEDQEHPLGPVGRAPPDGVEQVAGMMAQGATIIGDDGEDFDETIGEVSDTGIDS